VPHPPEFKSGTIAIVGPPNAGKSTLLNRILGIRIAATSRKPQTTRTRILGVFHRESSQMVFLDTPGLHAPRGALPSRMVETACRSLGEVDLVLAVADSAAPHPDSEAFLLAELSKASCPVLLALNKIDAVPKTALLPIMERWSKAFPFAEIIPISARDGLQIDVLLDLLESLLPPGPPLYPPETVTDLPERVIAAEMIREKVFRLTGQEVPYATAVTIDKFSEEKNGALITIHATIHVERESQKGILIGRGGRQLKAIGRSAREEIERLLGTPVFLHLWVRVQKDWRKDPRSLARFGY